MSRAHDNFILNCTVMSFMVITGKGIGDICGGIKQAVWAGYAMHCTLCMELHSAPVNYGIPFLST